VSTSSPTPPALAQVERPEGESVEETSTVDLTPRRVALALVGLTLLSTLVRMLLVSQVQAPTVFSDEIGYEKLAQSIGLTGHLGLFDDRGLSYSPLYPALLSPIYALGASAPVAYSLIKMVNALLISLAVFPIYGLARFVLPRRFSLLVAALSVVAPVMTYSSFSMSENLAYPVALLAFWTMVRAIRDPGPLADALLLVGIGLATAARVQLVALFPAALTAIVLAAVLSTEEGESRWRGLERSAKQHLVLVVMTGLGLAAALAAALGGGDLLSLFGRYSNVGKRGLPNLWDVLKLIVRHLAELDLAVGVVPFVGALVAAAVFARAGRRREHAAFASVALAVTAWLLLEVAVDAALFDAGDIPRIHERFLVYVVPFFLIALVVAARLPESRAPTRLFLSAAGVAALLPALIPFSTVVNNTIAFESLGLLPLSRLTSHGLAPVKYAILMAIWGSATLAFLFVYVRARLRTVVILVLLPFVAISGLARLRIEAASAYARSLLPAHVDWVDRTKPSGTVVLVTAGESQDSALQTAYGNLSIDRVVYLCNPVLGPEFGEQPVTIDSTGLMRDPAGPLRADYVVVPGSVEVQGRLVARNRKGAELLVAPATGTVTVPLSGRNVKCTNR
jgi:hypothetical protein